MKRMPKMFFVALLLCLAFASLQRPSVFAQNDTYKIGVVNVRQVGASYAQYKSKYEDLEKQQAALQSGVETRRAAIEKAKADFESRRSSMTPEDASAMELKIRADMTDFQAELTKGQQKLDSMTMEMNVAVFKDIQATIDAVADKGGYHLILSNERGPASAVLFAHNSIDITSQIIEALNKK